MKRFILIIVFVFLIAILISFNYLLWDREKQLESFQDLSDSKNLTIDTLSEKMNNLDRSNKELEATIESLTKEKSTQKYNYDNLYKDYSNLKKEVTQKNSLIQALKGYIDSTTFNDIIKKWVEALSAKNYTEAHSLISNNSTNPNLRDVEVIKEVFDREIKAISLKSSELYSTALDNEHISKLQFRIIVQVDKPENADEVIFKAGENEKYITMDYEPGTGAWHILDISDAP